MLTNGMMVSAETMDFASAVWFGMMLAISVARIPFLRHAVRAHEQPFAGDGGGGDADVGAGARDERARRLQGEATPREPARWHRDGIHRVHGAADLEVGAGWR